MRWCGLASSDSWNRYQARVTNITYLQVLRGTGNSLTNREAAPQGPCSVQLGIICTCYHILRIHQINTDQGIRVLSNHHFINTIVILVHGYEQGNVYRCHTRKRCVSIQEHQGVTLGLIKWWLIIYECVCRYLYDVEIPVHGYEEDKRIRASEIILHLWECDLLYLLFL